MALCYRIPSFNEANFEWNPIIGKWVCTHPDANDDFVCWGAGPTKEYAYSAMLQELENSIVSEISHLQDTVHG